MYIVPDVHMNNPLADNILAPRGEGDHGVPEGQIEE